MSDMIPRITVREAEDAEIIVEALLLQARELFDANPIRNYIRAGEIVRVAVVVQSEWDRIVGIE